MGRLFGIILGFLMFVTPVVAQDSDAIEDVIANQLSAFNDRDVQTAWSFASPMIQGLFGNPQNFGTMVEQGYPMVWTNSDAQFLELREIAGQFYQKVMIRDATGQRHLMEYAMIDTPAGWLINGVSELPLPDVGT
jgi:Domain of unknown function (DUF4864)